MAYSPNFRLRASDLSSSVSAGRFYLFLAFGDLVLPVFPMPDFNQLNK